MLTLTVGWPLPEMELCMAPPLRADRAEMARFTDYNRQRQFQGQHWPHGMRLCFTASLGATERVLKVTSSSTSQAISTAPHSREATRAAASSTSWHSRPATGQRLSYIRTKVIALRVVVSSSTDLAILYGVFEDGGSHGDGAVYELSPAGSGWTEQILYGPGGEEWNPLGGLIMDPSGNLYGTVPGFGGGVFELTHTNGWIFNELYDFGGSGEGPMDKLVMDSAGNLYGTTCQDGDFGSGGVFELVLSNGTWNERWLHSFTGGNDGNCPMSNLVFDANGNLYGTTSLEALTAAGLCLRSRRSENSLRVGILL